MNQFPNFKGNINPCLELSWHNPLFSLSLVGFSCLQGEAEAVAPAGLPSGRGEERGDVCQTPALSSGLWSRPCWGGFSATFPPSRLGRGLFHGME